MSERERFDRWWASEGVKRFLITIGWAKDVAWLAAWQAWQAAAAPSGKLTELQNAANWMWEQAKRKDIGPSRREAFELSARRLDAALAEEGK